MRRRGISPVIAVLLLIVIAVAAAILTYVWITGYVGTLQSQATAQQVQERLKIDGIKVDTSDEDVDLVYVRNIGDVQVKIAAVYLLDSNGNILAINGSTLADDTLDPGELVTVKDKNNDEITWNPPVTLESGKAYVIKIVTDRGTEVTYQFTYRA